MHDRGRLLHRRARGHRSRPARRAGLLSGGPVEAALGGGHRARRRRSRCPRASRPGSRACRPPARGRRSTVSHWSLTLSGPPERRTRSRRGRGAPRRRSRRPGRRSPRRGGRRSGPRAGRSLTSSGYSDETPSTRGFARPAGESTFQGSTSIFATTRSTPGTASRIASASRAESPARLRRISGELVLAVEALVLHHHVAQAHRVDDLEGLALGPRADREHRDHGAHAEDDPEHREERAQRVVAQALEARRRATRGRRSPARLPTPDAARQRRPRASPSGRAARSRRPRRGPCRSRPARCSGARS